MQKLLKAAKEARENAYAPYSNFKVGAAILLDNDQIIQGCNIENVSYGLTMCAERVAIGNAIVAGFKQADFKAIAIVAKSAEIITPCGACRQVMAEFCDKEINILISNLKEESVDNIEFIETTLVQLLPNAFNRSILNSQEGV